MEEELSFEDEHDRREHNKVVRDALRNWQVAARCPSFEFEDPWDAEMVREDFLEYLDYYEGAQNQPTYPEDLDFVELADHDVTCLAVKLKVKRKTAEAVRDLARVLKKHREFDKMSTDELRDLLWTEHHSGIWNALKPFSDAGTYDRQTIVNEAEIPKFLSELEVVCRSVAPENKNLAFLIGLQWKSWKQLASCSRWQMMELVTDLGRATVDKFLCIVTMFAHGELRATLDGIFKAI